MIDTQALLGSTFKVQLRIFQYNLIYRTKTALNFMKCAKYSKRFFDHKKLFNKELIIPN